MNLFNKLLPHKRIINILLVYLFLSFAGYIMIATRAFFTGGIGYNYLTWNLFLTWIPLVLSLAMNYIYAFYKQSAFRTLLIICFGVAWLIFYPNSPYIITDFIHLGGINFYSNSGDYSMKIILWYDFIMNALFILTGFFLGFISLYLIQRLIFLRFNRIIGWLFVVIILFLSSYGIYLGRFIRWNSWDMLFNPGILANSVLDSLHRYTLAFTIMFGLFLILMYLALYFLTSLNEKL